MVMARAVSGRIKDYKKVAYLTPIPAKIKSLAPHSSFAVHAQI